MAMADLARVSLPNRPGRAVFQAQTQGFLVGWCKYAKDAEVTLKVATCAHGGKMADKKRRNQQRTSG
jgi:hypothetical protein